MDIGRQVHAQVITTEWNADDPQIAPSGMVILFSVRYLTFDEEGIQGLLQVIPTESDALLSPG
jgi:hypothetical protein